MFDQCDTLTIFLNVMFR